MFLYRISICVSSFYRAYISREFTPLSPTCILLLLRSVRFLVLLLLHARISFAYFDREVSWHAVNHLRRLKERSLAWL
jgi:hypothetical protein